MTTTPSARITSAPENKLLPPPPPQSARRRRSGGLRSPRRAAVRWAGCLAGGGWEVGGRLGGWWLGGGRRLGGRGRGRAEAGLAERGRTTRAGTKNMGRKRVTRSTPGWKKPTTLPHRLQLRKALHTAAHSQHGARNPCERAQPRRDGEGARRWLSRSSIRNGISDRAHAAGGGSGADRGDEVLNRMACGTLQHRRPST